MKSKFVTGCMAVMLVFGLRAQEALPTTPAQAVDPNTPGYPGGATVQPPPPTSTGQVPPPAQPTPAARPLPEAKLPKASAIRELAEGFAASQIDAGVKPGADFEQAIYLTGLMALDGMSSATNWRAAVVAAGTAASWAAGDGAAFGFPYGEAWSVLREPRMIAAVRSALDERLPAKKPAAPDAKKSDDESATPAPRQRWEDAVDQLSGAGALAKMYAATGQKKYRDALVKHLQETRGLLFDSELSLYHRDAASFDQQRNAVPRRFDGFANGCALAGLVRALQVLPANDAAREDLADQFKSMALRLVDLRLNSGGWAASIAVGETESKMEAAATALISFGLAYGLNQGLLKSADVSPVLAQAWAALSAEVRPPAENSEASKFSQLSPRAAGAVLIAAAELYRIGLLAEAENFVEISVANEAQFFRPQETFEANWEAVSGRATMMIPERLTLIDAQTSRILDTQLTDVDGNSSIDGILSQSDFLPGETKRFLAFTGVNRDHQPQPALTTFSRFVPERLDDFAWENDRIAFRVYGPALLKEPGETAGSGIDVWCKRVRHPVIDKWYATDDYAEDKGEGCDFFRVGQTRGVGGSGVMVDGRIAGASVFAKWRILANGPIRTVFELEYSPYPAYHPKHIETNAASVLSSDDLTNEVARAEFQKRVADLQAKEAEAEAAARRIAEKKIITLERGSNFNRVQTEAFGGSSDPFTYVTGIATQPGDSRLTKDEQAGWVTYTAPDAPPNGSVHGAIIARTAYNQTIRAVDGHNVVEIEVSPGQIINYHVGAAWSRGLDFPTHEAWTAYVKNYAARIASPVKVSVK